MLPSEILDGRNGRLVMFDLFLLDIGFVVPDHLALLLLGLFVELLNGLLFFLLELLSW